MNRRALPVLAFVLALPGCASSLTDESARTLADTRASTVHASEKLAETAERLPATFDALNRILAAGAKTSEDARSQERELAQGVAAVASSTALAIDRASALVSTLDGAGRSASSILEDARRDGEATREDRLVIVESVARITSSAQVLIARAEAASRTWEEGARDLRDQQSRAARALADLAESSARVSADVAVATSALGRLARDTEPDVASSSRSVAEILAGVAKITSRLSSEEVVRSSFAVDAVVGAIAGASVILLVLAARFLFKRAVAAAVLEKIGPG
jgi:hypothetical protein